MPPPDATLNDFKGTRYRNVVYQLPDKVLGVSIMQPHGLVPWDGGFGVVVKEQHGDGTGRDRKDFLNVYTAAVKDWLSGIFTVAGNAIPVITSRPKTAFSDYWYSLPAPIKKAYLQACAGGGPDVVDPSTPPPPNFINAMYPLPFVSFDMVGGPEPRPGANAVPLRNLGFLDIDRKQTSWSRHPTPYTLTFQIEVWSKFEAMHKWWFSLFDEAFQSQMSYMGVPSFLSDKAENLLAGIKLKGAVDNSDLEATPDKESVFRWTLSIEVEAWKFYEIRSAPTVHTVEIGIHTDGDSVIVKQRYSGSVSTPISWIGGGCSARPVQASLSDFAAEVELPHHTLGDPWLGFTSIGPITVDGLSPELGLGRIVMKFTLGDLSYVLDSDPSDVPDGPIIIIDPDAWLASVPGVQEFLPIIGNWIWDMKFYPYGSSPLTIYKGTLTVEA